MRTSSVLVDPNQFSSHTSAIRSSRVTTRPARLASATSRSNSLRDESSLDPSSTARRADGSISRPPIRTGAIGASRRWVRRSTARMRTITSAPLNGLTT